MVIQLGGRSAHTLSSDSEHEEGIPTIIGQIACLSFLLFTDLCELTSKSATAIILEAYGEHFIKEVSRIQLLSAVKTLPTEEKKSLQSAEKSEFYLPLGKAFVTKGIVCIKKGASLKSLSRQDVQKVGAF